MAPSVLFTENVVSDEIFQPTEDKRPNPANILSCKFKASDKICLLHLKKSGFLIRVHILMDDGEKVINWILNYKIHASALFGGRRIKVSVCTIHQIKFY